MRYDVDPELRQVLLVTLHKPLWAITGTTSRSSHPFVLINKGRYGGRSLVVKG